MRKCMTRRLLSQWARFWYRGTPNHPLQQTAGAGRLFVTDSSLEPPRLLSGVVRPLRASGDQVCLWGGYPDGPDSDVPHGRSAPGSRGRGATADDKKPAEFITKAGTDKLYDGKLAVTVTAGATGTAYTFTQPPRDGKSVDHRSGKDAIKKGAAWFIYPESADKVWVYTETDLAQWEITDEKSTVKEASAAPEIVKATPEAVRKRLPDEFRKKFPDK